VGQHIGAEHRPLSFAPVIEYLGIIATHGRRSGPPVQELRPAELTRKRGISIA
jgi:hypothetical protein